MPITTFSVDVGTPCMDATAQVGSAHHRLELNRFTECPLEKSTGLFTDPRYDSHLATKMNDIFFLNELEV